MHMGRIANHQRVIRVTQQRDPGGGLRLSQRTDIGVIERCSIGMITLRTLEILGDSRECQLPTGTIFHYLQNNRGRDDASIDGAPIDLCCDEYNQDFVVIGLDYKYIT